jgi:hypothetical protein
MANTKGNRSLTTLMYMKYAKKYFSTEKNTEATPDI